MPEELEPVWPCYRLVVDLKIATWTEVTHTMSIDDVDRLCIAADAVFDAQNAGRPTGPVSDKHAPNYVEQEFEFDTDPPPAIVPGSNTDEFSPRVS